MRVTTYMIIFTTVFITFLSGKHTCANSDCIKYSIEVLDSVVCGLHKTIVLFKMDNSSDQTVTVRNPAYYGNVYPRITFNNKEVSLIKIKANPDNFKKTIIIERGKTIIIPFEQTVEELMGKGQLPVGKYEIKFLIMTKLFVSITKETDALEISSIFFKK